ncbi:DUF4867 domain-containing protein [Levilactobacillus zymae]|uniref:DUF4867 domain-containing protein n=1 Tax=Levilactobacillus zymae TaxID=267363 RepID=A0ABQ0WVG6_9LACO|nr:DUF4867 family protein [Levilactobacillus zymae]KRL15197.1 hypothetical protein FD38_GL001013 [Levilactobacillus zymae DSM 19395]QFR61486.1 DUF4867 family protein [Levilactobacillus zymae]GEO71634.1 DUF4867 domain-containing protein [Levilactobacillus zymae]
MQINDISDAAFQPYGRCLTVPDSEQLLAPLTVLTRPTHGTRYVADDPGLAVLPATKTVSQRVFGGLTTESGYCLGNNHQLNCLEYHSSSEINVAASDFILWLGQRQDIQPDHTYDTGKLRAFLVPYGSVIEIYATTLHFAPATVPGQTGFTCGVILPQGTNQPLATPVESDPLLFAQNKWLIAHPDAHKSGAFVGLTGENLTLG